MSSNGEGGAVASATPNNEAATTPDGAPAPTAVNGAAKPNSAAAPRAKIAISLKKKSRPKKAGGPKAPKVPNASSLLAEEYGTIAEEAAVLSQQRKEEGTVLVIPCQQSTNEEEKRKRPLLAGRLALLRQGGEAEENEEDDDGAGDPNGTDDTNAATGPATTDANEATAAKDDDAAAEDDEAMQELIQSANQKDGDGDGNGTTHSGRGLVIAAPAQNSLTTQPRTTNTEGHAMNDEEVFQQELSHHAADVAPTSNVYANVAISDFGSALLRGMGWTGGSTDKKGDKQEETAKQRPHRLGLGATPVPLPSAGASKSSGGIHRRARRPDEVRRDEEREKQQEEAEKRAEEKKRLDVQVTLQNGSVVHVADRGDDGNGGNGTKQRALVVQTAGVPGLNRILVQMEGASEKTSVAKGSVALCSWEELEATPFTKRQLKNDVPKNGAREAKQKSESRRDSDRDNRDDRRQDGRERDRRDYSDDDSRRRSEKRKRKKKDRRDRSRSRSDSRERTSRRKDRTRRSRSRSGSRERQRRKKDSDRRRRDRSRSPDERSKSKRSKQHHPQQQQQLHWLIPNIRVRLVSKKMPKYHLQKGVVQDVLAQTQQTSGPKAVLLMEDGQVLDKVPERYLETALPRTGGNVIILEGREKQHRWKKGRLLEKQSSEGYGVVQLEEDLEVVKVDLDGLAEWCGRGMDE